MSAHMKAYYKRFELLFFLVLGTKLDLRFLQKRRRYYLLIVVPQDFPIPWT